MAAEANRPISGQFAARLAKALSVRMSDISDWPDDDAESDAETKIPA